MYFRDITGHHEIKKELARTVRQGFIPHARLISGKEGIGTLPLALAYARYLHCENRGEEDACGTCASCKKIDRLSHPDLHFVFPIINKKKNKEAFCDDFLPEWRDHIADQPYTNLSMWLEHIAADNAQGMIYEREAKAILQKLSLKAYESPYKIMIIWHPEKMNAVASNKLLKLLEEPPERTVFLLVSENQEQIINTIRSRSQLLTVPPVDHNDILEALKERYDLPEEDAEEITRLARGSYLEAIRLIETTDQHDAFLELFISIMRNSWTRNVKEMKVKADYFASLGRDKQKLFLTYAQRLIRENFICQLKIEGINYLNRKEKEFSLKFAPYINVNNVIDFMEDLALAERHIEQNVNPRMIFFDLSLKIAVLLKK